MRTRLPYTICFCLCGEHVLMLYRRNAPNAGRWNGLGGKIEAGETAHDSIHREILEEAEIDLRQAQELRYTGVVTWVTGNDPAQISGGMHTFLAHFAADFPRQAERPTPEGLLAWKALSWACDPTNGEVVSNISRFLPLIMEAREPLEYRCYYQKNLFSRQNILRKMEIFELQPGDFQH